MNINIRILLLFFLFLQASDCFASPKQSKIKSTDIKLRESKERIINSVAELAVCKAAQQQIQMSLILERIDFDNKAEAALKGEEYEMIKPEPKSIKSTQRKINKLKADAADEFFENPRAAKLHLHFLQQIYNKTTGRDATNDLHRRMFVVKTVEEVYRLKDKIIELVERDTDPTVQMFFEIKKKYKDYMPNGRENNHNYKAIHIDIGFQENGSKVGIIEIQIRTVTDAIWYIWDHRIYNLVRLLDSKDPTELQESLADPQKKPYLIWLRNPINRAALQKYSDELLKALTKGVRSPQDIPSPNNIIVPIDGKLAVRTVEIMGKDYFEKEVTQKLQGGRLTGAKSKKERFVKIDIFKTADKAGASQDNTISLIFDFDREMNPNNSIVRLYNERIMGGNQNNKDAKTSGTGGAIPLSQ